MKSFQKLVTSANSPLIVPLDVRGGTIGLSTLPAGSGNYTVQATLTPFDDNLTAIYFAVPDMTAATAAQQTAVFPITGIKITLNSGTSVAVDIAQSDV